MFEEEFMEAYFNRVKKGFEIIYTNEMLHQFIYEWCFMRTPTLLEFEYNAGLLITCFQLLFHCFKYWRTQNRPTYDVTEDPQPGTYTGDLH